MSKRIAIVSPNFYPRTCGIGDHSARLAGALRARGHDARVFSRTPAEPNPADPTVDVSAPGGRGPLAIAHGIANAIRAWAADEVVIQYTSQMWGASRFGSPALAYLATRVRRSGARVTVIAHELHVPWLPRPDLLVAAALQRVQLAVLLRAADRAFVTTGT